jgi:hypothetical protein
VQHGWAQYRLGSEVQQALGFARSRKGPVQGKQRTALAAKRREGDVRTGCTPAGVVRSE